MKTNIKIVISFMVLFSGIVLTTTAQPGPANPSPIPSPGFGPGGPVSCSGTAPVITGSASICGTPSAGNVYSTEAGMSGYAWTISAGGTINSGAGTNSITVTWNAAGTQSVSVNYISENGCRALTPTVKNITVNPLPVPAISGPTPVCVLSAGNVYTSQAGMTGYNWTVSPGGTITSGIPSTIMTESFENGGNTPAGWATEVVSGGNTISFATGTFYPSGFAPYNGTYLVRFNSYNVNGGINRLKRTTPISTVGYNSVAIDFAWLESTGYSSQNDKVEVQWSTNGTTWNSAGIFARYNAVQGWKTRSQVLPSGAIGQPALYIAFLFTSDYGNDCYLDLAHVTAKSSGTQNTITVQWLNFGAQWVSVNYTNQAGCTAASPVVYPVSVKQLPVPAITGPASVCIPSVGIAYRTSAGMTAYDWTVSEGGTIIDGGTPTSYNVVVTWHTSGTQRVTVNYTNADGCRAADSTVKIVSAIPRPVPSISGPATVCLPSSGNVYSTQSSYTGYLWDISAGGTITSGAGTNSITVTWNTAGAQQVSVNFSNAYGCFAASPAVYYVAVNLLPTLSGPAPVCIGSEGNVYTTEAGMTGYCWNVSGGGSVTSGGGNLVRLMTQSFENGGTVPADWATEVVTGGNTISFVTGTSYPPGYSAYNGFYLVRFNSFDFNGGVNRLKTTVPISTSCFNNVSVDFAWLESSSYPAFNDKVEVQYSLNGTTWTTAGTFYRYNAVQGWKIKNQPLPPEAMGQPALYIAFLFTSGYGNDCYLDITHVNATSVGSGNTITVTWNTAGTQTVSVNYTNQDGCTAVSPTIYEVPVTVPPPATRTLTNITINNGQSVCYDATQVITAGGTGPFLVQPGGSVNLIAGQKITMLPTATISPGGYLHAFISSQCLYCSGVPGDNLVAARPEGSNGALPAYGPIDKQPDLFFKVYPNPTTGTFTLELAGAGETSVVKVEIYGLYGEKLLDDQFTGMSQREFTLEGLPAGIYFIRVFCGGNMGSKKIIRQ